MECPRFGLLSGWHSAKEAAAIIEQYFRQFRA